jgi:hypothetical protein
MNAISMGLLPKRLGSAAPQLKLPRCRTAPAIPLRGRFVIGQSLPDLSADWEGAALVLLSEAATKVINAKGAPS